MSCELIIGGARSGKSTLAERRAREDGRQVVVVVTAEALDEEMAARIERHRRDRPAHWPTVEVPTGLAAALRSHAAPDRVLVVDCLSLWLSNLMTGRDPAQVPHDGAQFPQLAAECEALEAVLPTLPGRVLLVANEVGLGLVPDTALGRYFRDEAGRLNQRVAAIAERVTLVVAGLALEIKGGGG